MLNDFDDIPVAIREDQRPAPTAGKTRRWVMLGGGLAAAVGLGLGGIVALLNASPPLASNEPAREVEGLALGLGDRQPLNGDSRETASFVAPKKTGTAPTSGPTSGEAIAPDGSEGRVTGETATVGDTTPAREDILGHYPFAEAPSEDLAAVSGAAGVLLRTSAAQAFAEMQQAAQREGITLVPLSGYRSVELQKELFFGVKASRGQTASERAKVSAPPGYSEHHTGYALDIGDGDDRAADVSDRFEATAAFQWLQANAPYYSFELSFPQDNAQGVSYEPWHWRYVGDQASLELFHKGR